jgi:hypothetical protein
MKYPSRSRSEPSCRTRGPRLSSVSGTAGGRGIRYGQDPENPDGVVRSGELVASRREALALLMTLSDAISAVEEARQRVEADQEAVTKLAAMFGDDLYSRADSEKLSNKIPAAMVPVQTTIASMLAKYSEDLDNEAQVLLGAGSDVTGAQLTRMFEIYTDLLGRRTTGRTVELHRNERRLRDILQLIAGAKDEGA